MMIFNSDQDDDDDDDDCADGNNDAGWVGLSHANVPPVNAVPGPTYKVAPILQDHNQTTSDR